MTAKAMKAARADVLGREVRRSRRVRGQAKRDMSGRRALFTQRHGRLAYRGTTRSRDTQVMPGHPMSGLWQTWNGASRSARPSVRRVARQHVPVWIDEMAGAEL